MSKTALQLLNEVGKNLRRSTGSTYTSLTQDQNAVSIVQFVNEAKRMVEDAWKWDALRTVVTFDGVNGTHSYDTGSGGVATAGETNDRSMILRDKGGRLQMWDVTDTEYRMRECSTEYAEHIEAIDSKAISRPDLVAIFQNGTGLTFRFPWAPSSARNYSARAIVPQDDLTEAGTTLLAPWRPVVLAATALALEDRGTETGGASDRWWDQYEDALGKAIGRNSDEWDLTLVAV